MVGVDFFVRKPSLPSKKLVTTAKCWPPPVVRKSSPKWPSKTTENNFEGKRKVWFFRDKPKTVQFQHGNGDLLYINSRLNLLKRQSEIALFENGVKKYSIRKKKKIFYHTIILSWKVNHAQEVTCQLMYGLEPKKSTPMADFFDKKWHLKRIKVLKMTNVKVKWAGC